MRFDGHKWIGLPLNLIIIILGIFLIRSIFSLRINEFSSNLRKSSNTNKKVRSAGLVARYQLIQKRFNQFKGNDNYKDEARLMAMVSGDYTGDQNRRDPGFLKVPALGIINLVNMISGSPLMVDETVDKGGRLIEMAYFYERKRQFRKAIAVYNAALKIYETEATEVPYIYLHRGFCLSLIGLSQSALSDYDKVISLVPDKEEAVTAEFLSSFLRSANQQILEVDKRANSVIKGRAYHQLMAYKKAIKIFNLLEKTRPSQRLYYYRGRSFEEIGRLKRALQDYERVMNMNPNSEIAKKTNRRRYILGTFYENDNNLKDKAYKHAKENKDATFVEEIKSIEKTINVKQVTKLKKSEIDKEIISFVNEQNKSKNSKKKDNENTEEETIVSVDEETILENIAENNKKIAKRIQEIRRETKKEEPLKKDPIIAVVKKKETPFTKEKLKKMVETEKRVIQREREQPITTRKIMSSKKAKLKLMIFTKSGDIFFGSLLNENSEILTIATIYGTIDVKVEDIVIKSKLRGNKVIK